MIDRYTKAVLTTIAACLVWLCVKDIAVVRPAVAQGPLQRVTIVGIDLPEWYYGPVVAAPRRNYVLPVWQTK